MIKWLKVNNYLHVFFKRNPEASPKVGEWNVEAIFDDGVKAGAKAALEEADKRIDHLRSYPALSVPDGTEVLDKALAKIHQMLKELEEK